MSTIDLIILGILLNDPKNAFELNRIIEDKQIDKLLKISKPAVYKCCKRLFKAGYLDGVTVKEGEMPEKVIYSVNQEGMNYFYELMEYFSNNLKPFYFDFNTFLWNIDALEPEEGLKMLQNLEKEIKNFAEWITQHEKEIPTSAGFAVRIIVKQYRMLILTLADWMKDTVREFKKENNLS